MKKHWFSLCFNLSGLVWFLIGSNMGVFDDMAGVQRERKPGPSGVLACVWPSMAGVQRARKQMKKHLFSLYFNSFGPV